MKVLIKIHILRITGKLKRGHTENLTFESSRGHNHNDLELQNLTGSNHGPYHDDSCPLPISTINRINRQNSSGSENTQNSLATSTRFEISNSVFGRMKFLRGRLDSISGSR